MKKYTTISILAVMLTLVLTSCRANRLSGPTDDKKIEQEIRALYDEEHRLIVQRDFAAQQQFYPEDFVVTNPFNMFIDKKKVLERIRGDIIKYTRYERQFDAFRIYGDTVIVIGSETVVPATDAARQDAGKTVHRRFTEVWLRRDGRWQKVVRHANNVSPE
jgi:ketosteroid isomerase-like protein